MALLHMLAQLPNMELVVAHFDHGIREDSGEDRQLVQQMADEYRLPFMYGEGRLGTVASESTAREARYAFLRKALAEHNARAIITAHHQDDVLETALVNLLRGTGRKGLSSLQSTGDILRPALHLRKQDLLSYASKHRLQWREDSTNTDDRYLRNYLRTHVVPKITAAHREQLLQAIAAAKDVNREIDTLLTPYISSAELNRRQFVLLPHAVAAEVMAAWLRRYEASFDRRTIERLVVFAKTAVLGKLADIDKQHQLQAGKEHIILVVKSARG